MMRGKKKPVRKMRGGGMAKRPMAPGLMGKKPVRMRGGGMAKKKK